MSPIELVSATEADAPVLANLLELYIHDFSEFVPLEVGKDGRFGYTALPLYWRGENRFAYLAKLDGNWIGFALVHRIQGSNAASDHWDMAEFFILRAHRRCHHGSTMAEQVFRRHPGAWRVRVLRANSSAEKFWQRVVDTSPVKIQADRKEHIDGRWWHIFSLLT